MESTTEQTTAAQTNDQYQHIKGVVESLLFVHERPVTLDQIKNVLGTVSISDLKKAIAELQRECEAEKRGITIVEIAGGYQMLSNPVYADYLRSFYKTKHKEKLSKPALESMAIIAYKQPVTRADIEMIRGVNSDGVVAHLQSKDLIKIIGRKDVPGRPFVYGTTKQFLEYFGLKSLDDLPALEEFAALETSEGEIIREEYQEETETTQSNEENTEAHEENEQTDESASEEEIAEHEPEKSA